jgi:hypothetical protein
MIIKKLLNNYNYTIGFYQPTNHKTLFQIIIQNNNTSPLSPSFVPNFADNCRMR